MAVVGRYARPCVLIQKTHRSSRITPLPQKRWEKYINWYRGERMTKKAEGAPKKKTHSNGSITLKVTNEEKRLRKAFGTLRLDQEILVDGLIRRAAFMRVQLEELEKDLTVNGLTEEFTQSATAPSYDRERPSAKQYHSLNGNYQKIMKQLTDLLPKAVNDGVPTADASSENDGFDKWAERSERS